MSTFKREVYASHLDNLIVTNIDADTGHLNCTIHLTSPHRMLLGEG